MLVIAKFIIEIKKNLLVIPFLHFRQDQSPVAFISLFTVYIFTIKVSRLLHTHTLNSLHNDFSLLISLLYTSKKES